MQEQVFINLGNGSISVLLENKGQNAVRNEPSLVEISFRQLDVKWGRMQEAE